MSTRAVRVRPRATSLARPPRIERSGDALSLSLSFSLYSVVVEALNHFYEKKIILNSGITSILFINTLWYSYLMVLYIIIYFLYFTLDKG